MPTFSLEQPPTKKWKEVAEVQLRQTSSSPLIEIVSICTIDVNLRSMESSTNVGATASKTYWLHQHAAPESPPFECSLCVLQYFPPVDTRFADLRHPNCYNLQQEELFLAVKRRRHSTALAGSAKPFAMGTTRRQPSS